MKYKFKGKENFFILLEKKENNKQNSVENMMVKGTIEEIKIANIRKGWIKIKIEHTFYEEPVNETIPQEYMR